MPLPGHIAAARPAAGQVIHVADITTAGTINISLCNCGAAGTFTLAIGSGASPQPGEYLNYDTPIADHQPYERTAQAVSAGQKVWFGSSTGLVDIRVHGF